MKHFITAMVILVPFLAFADEGGHFSAKTGAGIAVIDIADNLWTEGDPLIQGLDREPSPHTKVYPLIILDLRYISRDEKREYYFGSPMSEGGQLGLGAKQKSSHGTFDFFVFYLPFKKTWKNPYMVGIPRDETTVINYGGKVAWERALGLPLTLSSKVSFNDVKDDRIGEAFGELRRDGYEQEISASYRQALEKGFSLVPGFSFTRGEFKGESESFDEYSPSLGLNYGSRSLILITKLSLGLREYDGVHPLFSAKREEDTVGLFAMAIFPDVADDVLGAGYALRIGGMYSRTDPNITFFHKIRSLFFVGVAYGFGG